MEGMMLAVWLSALHPGATAPIAGGQYKLALAVLARHPVVVASSL